MISLRVPYCDILSVLWNTQSWTEDTETALKELRLWLGWTHAMQVFSLQIFTLYKVYILLENIFFNLFLIQKTSPQSRRNKTMLLLNELKPECDHRQFTKRLQKQRNLTLLYSQADTTYYIHALKINNN